MPETGLSCAGVIVFCCLVSACLAQHRAEVVDVQATTTRLDAARVTPRSASDTRTTTSTPLLYPSRLPDPPCDPRSSSSDCAIGPSKENARWLAPAQASADFGPLFSPPFASRQASLTSRSVLQTDFRDGACLLSPDLVEDILNAPQRMWLVDQAALDSVDGDVQRVMDCIQQGDSVRFRLDRPVQLIHRIQIQRGVTLGTFMDDGHTGRTRFRCPPNEGAFLLRSAGVVVFENITFVDCQPDAEQQAGIIEIEPCASNDLVDAVRLRHVTFRQNQLNGAAALVVTQPSCASVEMTDVAFVANNCSGVCFARLSLHNTLQRLTVTRNAEISAEGDTESATSGFALLSLPPASETTAVEMQVRDNDGTAVHADEAVLKLSLSTFSENHGRSVIVLEKAVDVTIANSTFQRNRAIGQSGSVLRSTSTASLRIEDSYFAENNATVGGAMALDHSNVELIRCRFEGNSAASAGGALSITNGSAFRIEETTFSRNRAVSGGAVMVQNAEERCLQCRMLEHTVDAFEDALPSCASISPPASNASPLQDNTEQSVAPCQALLYFVGFDENVATSGGAVYLSEASVALQNTTLERGSCEEDGAGILVTNHSRMEAAGSAFLANSGRHGSAVYASQDASVDMRDSRVEECRSAGSGGGLFLRDASLSIHSVRFIRTRAGASGGGISCGGKAIVVGRDVTFSRSTARRSGGGIFATDSCHLEINGSTVVENEATRSGGGIALTQQATATVRDTTFLENNATRGGALWVKVSSATVLSSRFADNTAVAGGASVAARGSDLSVNGSEFRGDATETNGASFDVRAKTHLSIGNTSVVSGSALRGDGSGGILLMESDLIAEGLRMQECMALKYGGAVVAVNSTIRCTECQFEDNRANRGAGAMSLAAPTSSRIPYKFSRCLFQNNTSSEGGAIRYEDTVPGGQCFDSAENCALIDLEATRFVNNYAQTAGGAIYKASERGVRFSCEERQSNASSNAEPVTRVISSAEDVCSNWRGNDALTFGPFIASAHTTNRYYIENSTTGELEVWHERYWYLEGHRSGDPLPKMAVEVIDEFEQGPVFGVKDDPQLIISSANGFMNGTLHVPVTDGSASIDGIAVLQMPAYYEVLLRFSDSDDFDRILNVHVRPCSLGEMTTMDGTYCQPCTATQCNFNPEQPCQSCPEHGDCSQGNVLHPVDGYWHSHPCSESIHQCLTEEACTYADRKQRLAEVTDDVMSCECANQDLIDDYSAALCKEGYEGPLCGSCSDDYGRSPSVECAECDSRYGNVLLCLLSVLLLLLLSSVAIRGGIAIAKPIGVHRSQRLAIGRTSGDAQTDREDLECPSLDGAPNNDVHDPAPDPECNTQALNQHLIEVFKMTLNFLQVVAVAFSINVDWTSALLTLFGVSDFMGGAALSSVGFSIDCLLPADVGVARSILRTALLIAIPLIISSFFIVFWACATLNLAETWSYFTKRLLLSFLVVSYVSYQSTTKTAVGILSCIRVQGSCTDSTDPSSILQDDSIYWSVDTSIECYEGSHATVAGTLGWPLVTLFSMGFPMTMALALIHTKPEDRESNSWMREASGFLYGAYRQELVFWESLVALRKALLVIVASFAYSLGGNVQGILAVCILTAALFLHFYFRPFRSEFDRLNALEGASLMIGQFIFACGLLLNDEGLSNGGRWALGFILFATICGLLCIFLREWATTFAAYARIVLKAAGVEDLDARGRTHILFRYAAFHANHLLAILADQNDQQKRSSNAQSTIV